MAATFEEEKPLLSDEALHLGKDEGHGSGEEHEHKLSGYVSTSFMSSSITGASPHSSI